MWTKMRPEKLPRLACSISNVRMCCYINKSAITRSMSGSLLPARQAMTMHKIRVGTRHEIREKECHFT